MAITNKYILELIQFCKKYIISQILILINVLIFIIVLFIHILGNTLLPDGALSIERLIEYDPMDIISKPWTIFTYVWVHYSTVHIVINMVILYFFTKYFIKKYSLRELYQLYILSGILIAVLYFILVQILSLIYDYSVFFFLNKPVIGASGSITTIAMATLLTRPTDIIEIGAKRIKFITFSILIILLISVLGFYNNLGGLIIHILGCIIGWIWYKYKKHTYSNISQNRVMKKLKYSGYRSLNSEEKSLLTGSKKVKK